MFGDRIRPAVSLAGTFTADATRAIGRVSGDCLVKVVDVFNTAAVATHATNYVTFKLINLGTDGTGTTVIAAASTSQTGGSAIVANKAFPLTITAANVAVADGETLGFIYDEQTTDVADSVLQIVVRTQPVGAPS